MAGPARALRTGISTARLTIAGPAGPLEAITDRAHATTTSVAVICHPHPMHQGTMHNKVTHTLARCFARRGALAVRFNFRGVGESAGAFDNGDGETADARAVVEWACARCPDVPLYLAGFSFGSMVSVRVAAGLDVAALVTVAPAIRYLPDGCAHPECPWLVIQGLEDDVVAAEDVRAWCQALEPSPVLRMVPRVGHFFHGALGTIDQAIDDFLAGLAAAGGEPGAASC